MFYIQQRIGCFLAFTDYTIISRSYHDWKMISNDNLPLLPRVLSIQSHTVHGYVGNKAAIFPLQCLGFHVDSIHTVSLSNHPGYAKGSKGKEIEPNTFKDIVQGLIMNDLISYDIVLSGYVRNKDILTAILETLHSIRQVNPSVIYICDSVLGDHGRLYVPSELVSYYREHVIPHASVITPNQFEAETLSRISIHTITDAFLVCDYFHSLGTPVCVLKGVQLSDRSYSMIISYNNNSSKITYRINLSKISNRDFSGCGDLCSAIIAGLIHNRYKNLTGRGIAELLEETSSLVHNVISLTSLYNSKELSIIEAAPYFIQTRNRLLTDSSTHSMTKKLTEELTEDSKDIPKTESVLSKSYRIRGGICGIIFDMDGTLTLPGAIDFSAMYRRTGLTRDSALGDIMSQIRGM
jgi:pyridoxine kinase